MDFVLNMFSHSPKHTHIPDTVNALQELVNTLYEECDKLSQELGVAHEKLESMEKERNKMIFQLEHERQEAEKQLHALRASRDVAIDESVGKNTLLKTCEDEQQGVLTRLEVLAKLLSRNNRSLEKLSNESTQQAAATADSVAAAKAAAKAAAPPPN